MAKIYTRTGDEGETSLFGGGRVQKDHLRMDAVGTVDELNAALGVALAELTRPSNTRTTAEAVVIAMQHQLFKLGAELATPEPALHGTNLIQESDVVDLEAAIDRWEADLEPLQQFILPGGSPAAAHLHLARGICRRAERLVVRLAASEPIRGEVIRYLNRLSDALFVLARWVNRAMGVADVAWDQNA